MKRDENEFKVDEVVVSKRGVVSLYEEGMKSDNLKRWEPATEESYYVFWSSFKEIRIAKFSHMEDCKYVDENHFAYKYCMPIGLFDCRYNFKGE